MNFLEHIQDYNFFRSASSSSVSSESLNSIASVATSTFLSSESDTILSYIHTSSFESASSHHQLLTGATLNPTLASPESAASTDLPNNPDRDYDFVQNITVPTAEADTTETGLDHDTLVHSTESALSPDSSAETQPTEDNRNGTSFSGDQQLDKGGFLLHRLFVALVYALKQGEDDQLQETSVGSLVAYLVSPYCMLCIFMALIINRTTAFASTRRPAPLPIYSRLMVRSLPIFLLFRRALTFTTALSCRRKWLYNALPVALRATDASECSSEAMLWNLFWTICLAQFIETFSSVIQGRTPYSETGMSLFEFSMTFQEVQSIGMYSEQVMIFCLVCSLMLLTTQVFGAFNLDNYRLIPSAFFSVIMLSYFSYTIYTGTVLRFPIFFIIGYIPQLISCLAVIICASIYGLACLFAGGSEHLAISFKNVHISMRDDFYSCVVKLSVIALTAASKATYLNESAALNTPLMTWVETEHAKKDNEDNVLNSSTTNITHLFEDDKALVLAPSIIQLGLNGEVVENEEAKEAFEKIHGDDNLKKTSPYSREVPIPKNIKNPVNQFGRTNSSNNSKRQKGIRSLMRIRIALGTVTSVFSLVAYTVYHFVFCSTGLDRVVWYVAKKVRDRKKNSKGGTGSEETHDVEDINAFDYDPLDIENEEFDNDDDEGSWEDLKGDVLLQETVDEILYAGLMEDDESELEDERSKGKGKRHARKTKAYAKLLWGDLIPDFDNSKDYNPNDEDADGMNEEAGYEYSSDYASDNEGSHTHQVGNAGIQDYGNVVSGRRLGTQSAQSAQSDVAVTNGSKPKSTVNELYELLIPTPGDLLALLDPQNSEQVERRRLLLSHLQDIEETQDEAGACAVGKEERSSSFSTSSAASIARTVGQRLRSLSRGATDRQTTSAFTDKTFALDSHAGAPYRSHPPLTRSRYNKIEWDETGVLLQVISERRRGVSWPDSEGEDGESFDGRETVCVVCQCQPRQIVLWPCKCFAMCDDCRLTLAMKNFQGCVCCRRYVAAFSKIYVP